MGIAIQEHPPAFMFERWMLDILVDEFKTQPYHGYAVPTDEEGTVLYYQEPGSHSSSMFTCLYLPGVRHASEWFHANEVFRRGSCSFVEGREPWLLRA